MPRVAQVTLRAGRRMDALASGTLPQSDGISATPSVCRQLWRL